MSKFIRVIQVLIISTLVVLGFLAIFVQSVDITTGVVTDGLGRRLYPVEGFYNFITVDEYWAGLKWYIVDFIIFWGGVLTVFKIDDVIYFLKSSNHKSKSK